GCSHDLAKRACQRERIVGRSHDEVDAMKECRLAALSHRGVEGRAGGNRRTVQADVINDADDGVELFVAGSRYGEANGLAVWKMLPHECPVHDGNRGRRLRVVPREVTALDDAGA